MIVAVWAIDWNYRRNQTRWIWLCCFKHGRCRNDREPFVLLFIVPSCSCPKLPQARISLKGKRPPLGQPLRTGQAVAWKEGPIQDYMMLFHPPPPILGASRALEGNRWMTEGGMELTVQFWASEVRVVRYQSCPTNKLAQNNHPYTPPRLVRHGSQRRLRLRF